MGCLGTCIKCAFGVAPMPMTALPIPRVMVGGRPAANIMTNIPMANVPPFAMCTSPANPMVIALTAAALGVPTPAPCIPATVAPWIPTSPTTLVGGMPVQTQPSMLMCMWAGAINTTVPGQFQCLA